MNARILLAPFSALYWGATALRNWTYDHGLAHSVVPSVPTICVGNITVGGTGKTPLTEHLLRILSAHGPVGIVSRGYRRQTKGQVVATSSSSALEIGDEPRQMKSHFPESILVVDADRAAAIDKATSLGAKVILMDDGMQHRHVCPSMTIMVCDYARPMWSDLPLPAGNLREPWSGRHRAQIVVVNKCPQDLTAAQAQDITTRMQLSPAQSVYFSSIRYATTDTPTYDTPVVAVAGIGRPAPFFEEVERRHKTVSRRTFPDHHAFTDNDIKSIKQELDRLGDASTLICTEKDAMRLPPIDGHKTVPLPIRLQFLFNQESNFNQKILELCL